jgi:hypothetical protein
MKPRNDGAGASSCSNNGTDVAAVEKPREVKESMYSIWMNGWMDPGDSKLTGLSSHVIAWQPANYAACAKPVDGPLECHDTSTPNLVHQVWPRLLS